MIRRLAEEFCPPNGHALARGRDTALRMNTKDDGLRQSTYLPCMLAARCRKLLFAWLPRMVDANCEAVPKRKGKYCPPISHVVAGNCKKYCPPSTAMCWLQATT